jgi:hypothetical protein
MNRRLSSIAIGLVAAGSLAASLSSCNAPSCGPGTVQQQQSDGTLKCVAVDIMASQTPCDTDGGNAVIVGGKCVSAIQCDPATTTNVNGICVGTSVGMKTCHAPASGTICVSGAVLDFKTEMANTIKPLHVELYDPLALLMGGTPLATTDLVDDGGSYVFQDAPPSPSTLLVVLTGRTNANMTMAGTGAQGTSAGNSYRVDAYAIQKADSDKWNFDIATGGAQIARYFSDMKPAPNLLVANEKTAVAGVTLTENGPTNVPAGTKYFDGTLTAVDPALTVTGTSGTAIVAAPVMGSAFPTFSGMGPTAMPIAWETLPGGSAPGLVIITRFHPNM